MPKLIIKKKDSKKEEVKEFDREEISIGRSDTNSIILEGEGISRRHAKIIFDGGDYFVIDTESLAGTKLNGMSISKNEKYILKKNDIITINGYDIQIKFDADYLNQSFNDVTDSDILEVKLLKKVLGALDRETIPSLEVLNGIAEGKKAYLTEDLEEITIGRDPMCDFQIEEYVISRKHAKISRKWGGIVIQDLESKNGIYLNNRRITEEFLHDGDRIALGTIVLMFRNPQEINLDEISKEMVEKEREKREKIEEKKKREAEDKKRQREEEEASKETEEEDELSYTGKAPSEEEQEELVQKGRKRQYPAPKPKRQKIKFSAIELGLISLGILVIIFALIMILHLIF